MGNDPRIIRWTMLVLAAWSGISSQAVLGQLSSDQLLSDSVVFHVTARDVNQLKSAFEATEYGRLLQDPQLKPFLEDLKRQLQEKFAPQIGRLGLRWEDLQGIQTGEMAYATSLVEETTGSEVKTKAASLFMADVSSDEDAALQLLGKITNNLLAQGGRKQPAVLVDDFEVEHYQLKRQAGEINVPRVYVVNASGWIFASDRLTGIEGILAALRSQGAARPLANQPGYRAVRDRLEQNQQFVQSDLSWFTDPFPLARIISDEQLQPGPAARYAKAMERTGFDVIRGIGGDVFFGQDETEVFFQTFIAVPGDGELATRLKDSAKILTFPRASNSSDLAPQSWVRSSAASSLSWLWDSGSAFNAFEPLVDSLYDEGTFRRVIDDIRKAENTQVDLPAFAAALGPRWHLATEIVPPLNGDSEKMLLAIELNQPDVALPNLRNYLEADWYRARKVDTPVGEVELWEFQGEPEPVSGDPIESLLNPGNEPEASEGEEENLFLGMASFAIVPGSAYLLGATDSDYLLEVLKPGEGLTTTTEYQRVGAKLLGYNGASPSFFRMVYPDRVNQLSYELLRSGELPNTEVTLERFLRAVLQVEKGVIRKQEIDSAKMPADYQSIIAPHLGPAGWMLWVEQDGWYLAGIGLAKE